MSVHNHFRTLLRDRYPKDSVVFKNMVHQSANRKKSILKNNSFLDASYNKNSNNMSSFSKNEETSADGLPNIGSKTSYSLDSARVDDEESIQNIQRKMVINRSHKRKKDWLDENIEDVD